MLIASLETGITCSRIAELEQIFPMEGMDGELKMPACVGLLSLQRELSFFDGWDAAVFVVFSASSPHAWRIDFSDTRNDSSARRKSFRGRGSAILDVNTNTPHPYSVEAALEVVNGRVAGGMERLDVD